MTDNEDRYQEILRRIQAKGGKHDIGFRPEQSANSILDQLNAMDVLGGLVRIPHPGKLTHGPKVFAGNGWEAVLCWTYNNRTGGYQHLRVLGVWTWVENATQQVGVGQKHLRYQAPVYNAEAFHQLIRKGFYTYYKDNGNPPKTMLAQRTYQAEDRLELRVWLEEVLSAAWGN